MRTLLIVLDSVGIGGAPDAADYGDKGADTLGHIFSETPGLELPHLDSLGLAELMARPVVERFPGAHSRALTELSAGKDTTTGHWELAGVVTSEAFATFESFPKDLVAQIEKKCGVTFIGNVVASGTEIIERLGAESHRSGQPILYTSADSVFQIAAHEQSFGKERLYDVCRTSRQIIDAAGLRIGRVIARPFIGTEGEGFTRTANRHDYSLLPPRTVLDELLDADVQVISVGKISDIFAGQGMSNGHPTSSNSQGMQTIERLCTQPSERTLIFANLVDFDMLYGHRRDVAGYAQALIQFDTWLGTFLPKLQPTDRLIITADHGNDPTWHGTDHTRERVPLLTVNCPASTGDSFTAVADLLRHIYHIA